MDHFVGSETIQLLQGFNHFDPVTNGYLGIFPPGNGFDGWCEVPFRPSAWCSNSHLVSLNAQKRLAVMQNVDFSSDEWIKCWVSPEMVGTGNRMWWTDQLYHSAVWLSRCRSRASSVCLRSRRCRNALSWTLKVRPMKRVHKGTATMPWHGTSEVYCTSFKSSCGIDTSSLLDISWYQFPHKWPQFCGSVRLPVNLSVASFRLTITARPTPESVDSWLRAGDSRRFCPLPKFLNNPSFGFDVFGWTISFC